MMIDPKLGQAGKFAAKQTSNILSAPLNQRLTATQNATVKRINTIGKTILATKFNLLRPRLPASDVSPLRDYKVTNMNI